MGYLTGDTVIQWCGINLSRLKLAHALGCFFYLKWYGTAVLQIETSATQYLEKIKVAATRSSIIVRLV
jgi:hypothetical protein